MTPRRAGRGAGEGTARGTARGAGHERPADPQASALAAVGLDLGELVRFRRPDRTRWQAGTAQRIERDGSIGITDGNGAARAVPLANVLVRVRARRAGDMPPDRWEPLADRAARTEQLSLLPLPSRR